MGGTAFQMSPAGSIFYDFYGPNAFKADVSISMPELGSLLDHSGPHKEAEEYIARTFNADRSYIVTNGTSTANKIVGMYSAPAGSTVLVDRNCHKSLTHLMMMNDVTPLYFRPTRNAYGILGGIPQSEFSRETIAAKVAATPGAQAPRYAVITNSTYDGLLYNTGFIKEALDTPYIHFDSAWVPYTNFSPIYEGKCGMSGEAMPGKVFYETQSTHKLLAAFSQASMIHIKGDVEEETFNEAFMMHTSTSPQYGIVASTEISAAMMRGNTGKRLIKDSIDRAISFRKEIKRLREQSEGWFFDVWQPDDIDTVECWKLDPKDDWHGFKDIDDNHMYLDPIKVTLLTPGMGRNGQLLDNGIPASLVSVPGRARHRGGEDRPLQPAVPVLHRYRSVQGDAAAACPDRVQAWLRSEPDHQEHTAEPLSRRPELLRRDAHPGAGAAHSRADQQVPPAGADVQGVRRAAGDEDDPARRLAGAGRQRGGSAAA